MMQQLQCYVINLTYKKGKELFVADTLSCAPRTNEEADSFDFEVMTLTQISTSRQEQLRQATEKDPTIQKLLQVMRQGSMFQETIWVHIRKDSCQD